MFTSGVRVVVMPPTEQEENSGALAESTPGAPSIVSDSDCEEDECDGDGDDQECCMFCRNRIDSQRRQPQERGWFIDTLSAIFDDPTPKFTACEVRKHNRPESCWLTVGNNVYDATDYLHSHPGGVQAILRKSGGVSDCTEDFNFHRRKGQKEWQRFKIGKLIPCPCQR
ncbi:hypothetical protein THAOC_26563 [Thalassiosira oceanica]|uniref:Cytochrome b5 heme-binding domain-containing protein n=1 Tax=Thalassiosira oceanica TaxID=159749 RepID=K0RJM7_THAOC|nr:hypothetical protein THAOC_26563 [Thalassiosira oceanica]|mmetsp:Transcript_14945/g.34713  ORF Transcript_14945/g.34713 Transcript_14945/m.34713 type:complete len:169 (+) Transcript_14945:177-683(+)|eukprot:EJK53908.1 hypothetical protein THAOC_26563 [Thalassiosira oceanica]